MAGLVSENLVPAIHRLPGCSHRTCGRFRTHIPRAARLRSRVAIRPCTETLWGRRVVEIAYQYSTDERSIASVRGPGHVAAVRWKLRTYSRDMGDDRRLFRFALYHAGHAGCWPIRGACPAAVTRLATVVGHLRRRTFRGLLRMSRSDALRFDEPAHDDRASPGHGLSARPSRSRLRQ